MEMTATRLNIGGKHVHPDYQIVNVQKLDGVDHVADCRSLPFENDSVDEIYASHVLEHLGYQMDARNALAEWHRVLVPGGLVRIAVPDLVAACTWYLMCSGKDRKYMMRVMYGGQLDEFDFHYAGYDFDLLKEFMTEAGFKDIRQVQSFGVFDDCSEITINGTNISLNVEGTK